MFEKIKTFCDKFKSYFQESKPEVVELPVVTNVAPMPKVKKIAVLKAKQGNTVKRVRVKNKAKAKVIPIK